MGEIRTSYSKYAFGLLDEFAGNCLAQPQASQLVASKAASSRPEGFKIRSVDSAVATGRNEGKIAGVAEIDEVLARSAQEVRGRSPLD